MKEIDKQRAKAVFERNLKDSLEGKYFSPQEVQEMLDKAIVYADTRRKGKNAPTINLPCAFDTETTSTYTKDGREFAFVYEWTLGINGVVMIGRTLSDFFKVLTEISEILDLDPDNKTLTIYVHNFSFDFQFIKSGMTVIDYFARTMLKPMYISTSEGFVFRDSYVLTGYSLAKTAENLTDYKYLEKMTGDLDYSKIRHPKTVLTKEEIGYCISDVCIVMGDIAVRMDNENWNIVRIPMTKTGYARRTCREACLYGKIPNEEKPDKDKMNSYYRNHRELMWMLQIDAPELKQAKRAFSGGFTHANAWYVGKTLTDVASYDFTSSYPAVMVAEKYPMSRARVIDDDKANSNIRYYLKGYCCMFDIKLTNIRSRGIHETFLSASKCYKLEKANINNGRVWSADMLATTITDVDFQVIERCYEWDNMEIKNLRVYKRDYLPTPYIKTVLYLYKAKTELKGIDEAIVEYQAAKELLNSLYGMMVTDPVGDDISYFEGTWDHQSKNLDKSVKDYNQSKTRFTSYIWGVFVTAYARRNLWSGILELEDDYIYSDTDSVKIRHREDHLDYFEKYNEWITRKIDKACEYHGIPAGSFACKTIKGKVKQLGVWDYEGTYDMFKTLGAKRYMCYEDGEIMITIAGVNKAKTRDYLLKKYGTPEKVFEEFKDNLRIPATYFDEDVELDASGKRTHRYIDECIEEEIEDYNGIRMKVSADSFVHLEPVGYDLSISSEFAKFLLDIKTETV